jgi:hypothetical protein
VLSSLWLSIPNMPTIHPSTATTQKALRLASEEMSRSWFSSPLMDVAIYSSNRSRMSAGVNSRLMRVEVRHNRLIVRALIRADRDEALGP